MTRREARRSFCAIAMVGAVAAAVILHLPLPVFVRNAVAWIVGAVAVAALLIAELL